MISFLCGAFAIPFVLFILIQMLYKYEQILKRATKSITLIDRKKTK